MKTKLLAFAIREVNHRNKVSTCSKEVRAGWNSLLEELLCEEGEYKGYNYLTQEEVPEGELAGIIGTYPNHFYPDETRRRY